jgi:hypothetical protein
MADSDRSIDAARACVALESELHVNPLRELELAVRVAEYECNRWAAFSLVEVEWIASADGTEESAGSRAADSLPEQANAELVRRALASVRTEWDGAD